MEKKWQIELLSPLLGAVMEYNSEFTYEIKTIHNLLLEDEGRIELG